MGGAKRVRTRSVVAAEWTFTADLSGPEDGDLVLLLHGFPQTRHTWRAELLTLADAGLLACAPDQRGYSPGARPAEVDAYRVELLVGDVLAMADALGRERFHLVGHDWGGHLAWVTAATHPDRVRTLSVISRPHPAAFAAAMRSDPGQPSRSGHHRSFLRPEATDELLADGAARLRGMFARAGVPPRDAETYLATLGDRDALDAAVNWYRAVGRSGLQAPDIPAVTMPALYVWGNRDQSVGRPAAEGTREYVDAPYEFVEVPEVGHFVTDEAPGVFPPLLDGHLRAFPDSGTPR